MKQVRLALMELKILQTTSIILRVGVYLLFKLARYMITRRVLVFNKFSSAFLYVISLSYIKRYIVSFTFNFLLYLYIYKYLTHIFNKK